MSIQCTVRIFGQRKALSLGNFQRICSELVQYRCNYWLVMDWRSWCFVPESSIIDFHYHTWVDIRKHIISSCYHICQVEHIWDTFPHSKTHSFHNLWSQMYINVPQPWLRNTCCIIRIPLWSNCNFCHMLRIRLNLWLGKVCRQDITRLGSFCLTNLSIYCR